MSYIGVGEWRKKDNWQNWYVIRTKVLKQLPEARGEGAKKKGDGKELGVGIIER